MHLARLALVGEALTADLGIGEIAEIAIRQGMAALDAEGGVLSILDRDRMVTPVLTAGYLGETIPGFGPLTLDRLLPITVAARDSVAVWVPNPYNGLERFPALADAPTASQAWAAVPLLDRGIAFGVLSLTFTAPRNFEESDRAFLTTLAHLTALALRDRVVHPSFVLPSRPRHTPWPAAPVEIALLDQHGTIVEVNHAWLDYSRRSGADPTTTGVGASYLAVCDRADHAAARAVGEAIRAALRGDVRAFSPVVIDCPFPSGETTATILVSPRLATTGEALGATVVVMAGAPQFVATPARRDDLDRDTER